MPKITVLFTLISVAFLSFCSGRFVKRDELKFLHDRYKGDFTITQKVDVGNNLPPMKPGARVKVYFKSDSESIKVYAYKYNEPREQAIGKNIMYLFETDFGEEEEYDRKAFLSKLDALLAPAN